MMNLRRIAILLTSLCAALTMSVAAKSKTENRIKSVGLTTENMTNPYGLSTTCPRFSWRIISPYNATRQTSYQILVASDEALLTADKADLWNSGIVDSDEQLWVEYGGKRLADNERAYWTVQVHTNNGVSDWAEPQRFSTGLIGESHWKGRWIGIDRLLNGEEMTYKTRVNARYIRKEFNLENKEVKRATAYVAVLGLYELYINGERQGDGVLMPTQTDTRRSIIYNTYDITSSLSASRQDRACIGVVLGNGRTVPMRYDKHYKTPFLGFPKCRVNIIVEYADGSKQTVASDERWKVTNNGPIRSNNEYDGEVYDARMEMEGWNNVGYDDSKWQYADRSDMPTGELVGQPMPNMTIVDRIKPVSMNRISQGDFIVDFGQNTAGWVQVKVRGNRGDSIKIKYAEKLDGDGLLYTKNLRDAESEDKYICSGSENGAAWHSVFSYHGFRYVRITGIDEPDYSDIEAQVVSDSMESIGSFVSSNKTLNDIHNNAWWGIRSNYKGYPVDCPQRNERQPWLGDRVAGCLGESYLFNNERLYSKWMRDICESQRSDGVLCDVSPAYWTYYNDDVTWPSALPFGLDMIYRQFGNKEPIVSSYPALKRWVNHVVAEYMRDGIITNDKYGDWCVPPEDLTFIHSQDPSRQTDGRLISTSYMIYNMRLMQRFAELAGHADDVEKYSSLENEMTEAFNRDFLFVKRGTSVRHDHVLYPDSVFYGNNTATSNILPLALGIVPDSCKQDVVRNVVRNIITTNGGHVSCGVIGISWLMRGLSDNGFSDVAFLLATNDTYPSWGYMLKNGATTIWELWNGNTANPAMNSGNHVMLLGDLLPWCYQNLGGIRNAAGSVAYKHIELRPDFEIEDLDSVNVSYVTPYGKVVSRWVKDLQHLQWHVELPVGVTADVYLPDGEVKRIESGKHDLACKYSLNDTLVKVDEFVYKQTDFPQCHASTIVELDNGDLVAAYFGGTKERNPDVCIWVSRKPKDTDEWSRPILAADGVFALGSEQAEFAGIDSTTTKASEGPILGVHTTWAEAKDSLSQNGKLIEKIAKKRFKSTADNLYRKACWNPVLFRMPSGELWLFYKIGLVMNDWTGWVVKSKDGGKTWTDHQPLEKGFLGPVKNKPVIVDNRLICPSSTENEGGWKFHFEILDLNTNEWKYVGPIERELRPLTIDMDSNGELIKNDSVEHVLKPIYCIQPSILTLGDGSLQAIGRTRNGKLASTISRDNGDTWSTVTLIDAPNNQSGTDALTMSNGTHVLIYNDFATIPGTPKGPRNPCSIAVSSDGQLWKHVLTLEDSPIGDYSYPAIIEGKDGSLHCVYTWRRFRIAYKKIGKLPLQI